MLQILECRRFTGTYIPLSKERLVKDYEIDLELGNHRSVSIDGEEFLLRRGDVCIRKPGQRICGKASNAPITQTSILLTVDFSGKQCPERYSRNVEGEGATWIAGEAPGTSFDCTCKFRYRQPDQQVHVEVGENGRVLVTAKERQRAVTPGQSAVLYLGETCLGGAVVEKVIDAGAAM